MKPEENTPRRHVGYNVSEGDSLEVAATALPPDERVILRNLKNHGQFKSQLVLLGLKSDLRHLDGLVADVARCWMNLAREHLKEGKSMHAQNAPRAAYSRAYYAAYNASKALRYLVKGEVSLAGDDHRRVADLPDSFPDFSLWVAILPELYQHRLRADYDNWLGSSSENKLSPSQCLQHADLFLSECLSFIKKEYGLMI